jgi:hypothetical protein
LSIDWHSYMVETTGLRFDQNAAAIVADEAGKGRDRALCVDINRTYGRGGPYYLVRLHWKPFARAARDGSLVRYTGPGGLHVFVERRLWRYFAWHPLRVHGMKLGPIRRLVPEAGPYFIDDLRAWEALHPSLGVVEPPAA